MAKFLDAVRAKAFGGLGGELVDADGNDGLKVVGLGFDRQSVPGEQGYNSMLAVVCGSTIMDAAKTLKIALELQESSDNISFDTAEVIFASKTVATGVDGSAVVEFVTSDAIDLKDRKRFIRINVTPTLEFAADLAHWGACCIGMNPQVSPAT